MRCFDSDYSELGQLVLGLCTICWSRLCGIFTLCFIGAYTASLAVPSSDGPLSRVKADEQSS